MPLDDQLYQSWLLQLQAWAAEVRLFPATVDALQLKRGQATIQLNHIAHRLENREMRSSTAGGAAELLGICKGLTQ